MYYYYYFLIIIRKRGGLLVNTRKTTELKQSFCNDHRCVHGCGYQLMCLFHLWLNSFPLPAVFLTALDELCC